MKAIIKSKLPLIGLVSLLIVLVYAFLLVWETLIMGQSLQDVVNVMWIPAISSGSGAFVLLILQVKIEHQEHKELQRHILANIRFHREKMKQTAGNNPLEETFNYE